MNDPISEEALRRLAERGTPRGADAVFDAASRADSDLSPLASYSVDQSRRRGRARLAIAAAVVVAVGGGGLALSLREEMDTTTVAGRGSTFCEFMSVPALSSSDLAWVYVEPGAEEDQVTDLAERLQQMPEVRSVQYIGVAESYQRFTELFPDDPALVGSVEPVDLPTSFEVNLVDRRSETRSSFRSALTGVPGVYAVSPAKGGPRLVDVFSVGLTEKPLRGDLLEGVLLHLSDLADGAASPETRRDVDAAIEAMVNGLDGLDASRRRESLSARDRIVAHTERTCELPALEPAVPAGSGFTTEPGTGADG